MVVARLDNKRKGVVLVRGMGRGQTFTAHASHVKSGWVQDDALVAFPDQMPHSRPAVNSCSWSPWLCGMMAVAGRMENCSNGGRQQTVSSALLAATLVQGKNTIFTDRTWVLLFGKLGNLFSTSTGLKEYPGARNTRILI